MTGVQQAKAWLLMLLAASVFFKVVPLDLGPANDAAMFGLFFGLNAPTLWLARGPRMSGGEFWRAPAKGRLLGGMALIALNFLATPVMLVAGKADLRFMLAMLTAQSLWLAWPAYWMLRYGRQEHA